MNKEQVTVKVINSTTNSLPEYKTTGSAGMDIRANNDEPITLIPFQRALIPTGLRIVIPEGYEAQVRPRSGLAMKNGVTVINTPGTIDSDFRGDIGVILINLGNEPFTIFKGDRIAQMVVAKHERVKWEDVDQLEESDRGDGGFGHTGMK